MLYERLQTRVNLEDLDEGRENVYSRVEFGIIRHKEEELETYMIRKIMVSWISDLSGAKLTVYRKI